MVFILRIELPTIVFLSVNSYVCSRTVKGYEHFNDKARGGTSGNCPLFDNVEERHEEEIQRAAEGAKERLRAEHPGLDDTDLEIHLSDEVKRREQERRLAAQPAHLRNPPNRGAAVNIPYIPPVPPLPPPPAGHQVPRAPPAPPAAPIQRSRVILRHGRQPAAQPAPPAPQQFEAEAMPFAMPAALPANYPYVMGGFQGLEQLHDNLQMLQQFAGIQPPRVVQQPPFYQAPPATPAADRVLPHMPVRNVTPKNPIHRRPPPPKTNID